MNDKFATIAAATPAHLVHMLTSGELSNAELTFAAEEAGRIGADECRIALLALMDHASPVVREGAVYGLAWHMHSPEVTARIRAAMRDDPSPGVRAAAAGVVDTEL